jgi:hypothetical protein
MMIRTGAVGAVMNHLPPRHEPVAAAARWREHRRIEPAPAPAPHAEADRIAPVASGRSFCAGVATTRQVHVAFVGREHVERERSEGE